MMSRLTAVIVSLFFLVALAPHAGAQEQSSREKIDVHHITIDVELNDDGSAQFTEKHVLTATGTSTPEYEVEYGTQRESELTDFTAAPGEVTETHPFDWRTDLAISVAGPGTHEITIAYTVSNFVSTLADGNQAIDWEFMPRGDDFPEQLTVSMHGPEAFSDSTSTLMSFGFEGTTEIREGSFFMDSTDLGYETLAHMIAILPPHTVATSATRSTTSDGLIASSREHGLIHENNNPSSFGRWLTLPLIGFAFLMLMKLGVFRLIFGGVSELIRMRKQSSTGFAPSQRFIPHNATMPPHHPYAVAALYEHSTDDLIKASMVKWLQEGALSYQEYTSGLLQTSQSTGLFIAGRPDYLCDAEQRLFGHFREAAGQDKLLKHADMHNYFRKRRTDFDDWQEQVLRDSRRFLVEHGLLKQTSSRFFGRTDYQITTAGQDLVDQIEGYRNYLRDGWQPGEVAEETMYYMWAYFLDAFHYAHTRSGADLIPDPRLRAGVRVVTAIVDGYRDRASSHKSDLSDK